MKRILHKIPGFASKNSFIRIGSYIGWFFILPVIILALVTPTAPTVEAEASIISNSSNLEITGQTSRSRRPVFLLQNGKVLHQLHSNSDGSFSFHVSDLSEGKHTYAVEACEDDSRKTCNSTLTTITIDQTDPATPITELTESTAAVDKKQFTLIGNAEPHSTITITGENIDQVATTNENGQFQQELILLPGKNMLSLSATDEVGNTSEPATIELQLLPPDLLTRQELEIERVTVREVVDGDTIKLEDGRTVRYIGIDTPETKHPSEPIGCFGPEASQKNKDLVDGQIILIEKDISETDRYGRLLRYIWLDNRLVNEELVRQGYARSSSYPPDIKYQQRFIDAEQQARTEKKGLWGEVCNPTPSPSPSPVPSPSFIPSPTRAPSPVPQPTTQVESNSTGSVQQQPTSQPVAPTNNTGYSCSSPDLDCGDFSSHAEAQAFFESCGGPSSDRHRLDGDNDGSACESL